MRILVAEDDSEYRGVLCETLELCGHTVLPAADGVEAFQLLTRNTVDIIISDIQMPNRTGTQLHESVRSDERLQHIPFIYITGFAILRMATPIDMTGLDFMVSKVPFERLLQIVDDIGIQRGILRNDNVALGTS
ncbi:MAG: CheA signal transduction histidine kinase [Bacteroidetes bacterium]|nr:CheA signal transduction histidine kinase [Bacteroidota bacterium]